MQNFMIHPQQMLHDNYKDYKRKTRAGAFVQSGCGLGEDVGV